MTIRSNLENCQILLYDLQNELLKYEVLFWPMKIREWLLTVNKLSNVYDKVLILSWAKEVMRGCTGSGSMTDLYICPENGHKIENNPSVITAVNQNVLSKVNALYLKAQQILKFAMNGTEGVQ